MVTSLLRGRKYISLRLDSFEIFRSEQNTDTEREREMGDIRSKLHFGSMDELKGIIFAFWICFKSKST